MTTLKLDEKNNLVFDTDFILLNDDKALIQDIRTLLSMFQTEYPFNIEMGLNWYNVANKNESDNADLKNAIIQRVKEDERVSAVQNVKIKINEKNKNYIVELDIIKKDGSVLSV